MSTDDPNVVTVLRKKVQQRIVTNLQVESQAARRYMIRGREQSIKKRAQCIAPLQKPARVLALRQRTGSLDYARDRLKPVPL